MNKKRSLRSNKGFTLIEILLVISLLMGIGIIEMRRDLSKVNDATAVSVGKQIAIVGEALDQYMASHINGLQHMGNASSGDQNCTVNSDYCDLNISTLINSGYLPATFNNSVKFGGGYTHVSVALHLQLQQRLQVYAQMGIQSRLGAHPPTPREVFLIGNGVCRESL